MKDTIKTYPVMLPTDGISDFGVGNVSKQLIKYSTNYKNDGIYQNNHLYLVSDREIRVGDWVINNKHLYQHTEKGFKDLFGKKVEASTNLLSISDHLVNTFALTIPVKTIENWVESKGTLKEVLIKSYTDCPNCEMCESAVDNKDCDTCKGEGFSYIRRTDENEVKVAYPTITNKDAMDKFIIVKDLNFTDYMKDDEGNIATYDSKDDALLTCGMYEFPNVLVLKVVYNHIDEEQN